jgi:hypothetical protein
MPLIISPQASESSRQSQNTHPGTAKDSVTMVQQTTDHSTKAQIAPPATVEGAKTKTQQSKEHLVQHQTTLPLIANDDAITTDTPSNTSQDRDYLTSLPAETLLEVILYLPMSSYLDLAHTAKAFRRFMKVNAARICNQHIRFWYPLEAKLLKSEMVSGWLVPTHSMIKNEEDLYFLRYHHPKELLECSRDSGNHEHEKHFNLLGEFIESSTYEDPPNHIKISTPGPQYLYFLECEPFGVIVEEEVALNEWESEFEFDEDEVYFSRFEDGLEYFWAWMRECNNVEVQAVEGKLTREGEGFSRELIWYYGVEHLKLGNCDQIREEKTQQALVGV